MKRSLETTQIIKPRKRKPIYPMWAKWEFVNYLQYKIISSHKPVTVYFPELQGMPCYDIDYRIADSASIQTKILGKHDGPRYAIPLK